MKSIVQILLFGIFFICTACVTLYKPNAINSPLLHEKGELNTTASVGLSGIGLFNAQAAYALTNHTAVMVDGMYHNRRTGSSDSSVEKLNMFFGEAGIGYFNTIGNDKKGLFQCYGGVGYGNSNDKIGSSRALYPEVSAKYYNIFIQPGLSLKYNSLEIAFDLRANYVHLFNIHAYLYDQFAWWNTDFHFYSDTSLYFVNLEPAITMKLGESKLKGIFQLGMTLPVIHSHSYFQVNTSSMLAIPLIKISVGLTYTLGKK
jgi:hypothetical protein